MTNDLSSDRKIENSMELYRKYKNDGFLNLIEETKRDFSVG